MCVGNLTMGGVTKTQNGGLQQGLPILVWPFEQRQIAVRCHCSKQNTLRVLAENIVTAHVCF